MGENTDSRKQQYVDSLRFIAEGLNQLDNLERIYCYAQELMWSEGRGRNSEPAIHQKAAVEYSE